MASCNDPSITYLNSFGYNVVRLPRAGIEPMDVLGRDGSLEKLGRLSTVWSTSEAEPAVRGPDLVTAIEGQRTKKLDLSVGLHMLTSIVQGFTGQAPRLDGAYKRARHIEFAFTNVYSRSVAPLEVGRYLAKGDLDISNPVVTRYFLDEDLQAFLITETLQSDSILVTAMDAQGQELALEIPALQSAVGGSLEVNRHAGGVTTLQFKGKNPIVFGFKVFAFAYSDGKWKLEGAKPSGALAFSTDPSDPAEMAEGVLLNSTGWVRLNR